MLLPFFDRPNCFLRLLTPDDVSDNYVSWLKDYEVVKFTEQKWNKHSRETVTAFVEACASSKNQFLFGIFFEGTHIGNIKLGSVNWHHKVGFVSYFIGERECYGQGIGSNAIKTVLQFGFQEIGLEKICAQYYEPNIASARALEKCGFILEGLRINQFIHEGTRINAVNVGLDKKTWVKNN
jgi:RimJ/RimL family protein N-acetyltransferase